MLTASGYRHTLTVFGIILGVIGALAALGLRAPRADEVLPAPARNLSTCVHDTAPKEMLKTPLFWLMFAMMTMMSHRRPDGGGELRLLRPRLRRGPTRSSSASWPCPSP